nr:YqhV family protein [Paenibacillus sp. GSMTC-2017]
MHIDKKCVNQKGGLWNVLNKIVLSMVMLRMLSGSIEICAALIMLRMNDIEKALVVNSSLALIGPLILIATTTIGLVGLSDKLSVSKFIWVAVGVICLMIGILKK